MPHFWVTAIGKTVQRVARVRGGGSAFPGLIVERLRPTFIRDHLSQLPRGTLIITGTNGKTTTTKIVVELLESHGLVVFSNRSGSNLSRGVASALLLALTPRGRLRADIAVLELDEAHAVHFVRAVPTRSALILNVARDQLDRFGELDLTADLLRRVAEGTVSSVVLNRDDRRLAAIGDTLEGKDVRYFGLSEALVTRFPSDGEPPGALSSSGPSEHTADVVLESVSGASATFDVGGRTGTARLRLDGLHNFSNAAAALATARAVLGEDADNQRLLDALEKVRPAYGRGETVQFGGTPLEIVLVKNPSGFRLSLESYPPTDYATMIAINDEPADGRDVSWLWDVDFDTLGDTGVSEVSGSRGYDMALRLQYDRVRVGSVDTDLGAALRHFVTENHGRSKRIYASYTAMLKLRRELSHLTHVEQISA